MDHPRPVRRALAAVALLAAVATGCSNGDRREGGAPQGDPATTGTLVGVVDGSDAYLAVVSDGDRIVGYLCDSDTVSSWFAPTNLNDDGDAVIESRSGDPLGTVTIDGETATGQVDLDGQPHPFSLQLVADDTAAGLYRATYGDDPQPDAETGWIVLPDGTQRGGVNSFIDSDAEFAVDPAPTLDTTTGRAQHPRLGTLTANRLTTGFIQSDLGD